MKSALITGITGQDGSYLAEQLLGDGYTVYGLVRRTSQGSCNNIIKLLDSTKLQLIQGDMTDLSSLIRAVETAQPNEVYNLAAQSHVRVSFDEPLHTFDVTGKGAVNLFEAVRLRAPAARIYQASSSEMFGESVDSDGFQRETTLFKPASPYGAAKLFAHNMALIYRRSYGLHISCGILFNHESPRRGDSFVSRKISKYLGKLYQAFRRAEGWNNLPREDCIRKVAESNFPKLTLGNIEACRDWGHAKDYMGAARLMLARDEPDTYVIATGRTHSVADFLTEGFRIIGIADWSPWVLYDKTLFRPLEVPYLRGDASKARITLAWEPKYDFKALVKSMVQHDADAS